VQFSKFSCEKEIFREHLAFGLEEEKVKQQKWKVKELLNGWAMA
jgi:hypothetical protein